MILLVLLGLPHKAALSWLLSYTRRPKEVALPTSLGPWQKWLAGWDSTFSTWSLIIPLCNPSFIYGGWLPRQWKQKLQALLCSRHLMLWNKPSQTTPTINFIYLLMILQLGQIGNSTLFHMVLAGAAHRKATGSRVPGFTPMTDTQLRWLK